MAVQKVLTIQDKILYQKSEPITEFNQELRNLVRDMYDTMYAAEGVGLAAVQIGILKRVLVIDLENLDFVKGVYVNPRVIKQSKEMQFGQEGCLSVPGLSADLARPEKVTIAYQNLKGKECTIDAEMLMARALLHEMDHLDGKVFVDLLEPDLKIELKEDIALIKKGKQPKVFTKPDYRQ